MRGRHAHNHASPMPFLQTGISLTDTPLDVLERVAVGGDELGARAAELSGMIGAPGCATVLSTCNRTELYAYVPSDSGTAIESMVEFMQRLADRYSNASLLTIAPYLTTRTGIECVRHLFSVASGLDSLVAGDAQVSSQVRGALHAASDGSPAVDHGLSRLFHAALRTGRRARKSAGETATDATVPAAGVALLETKLGTLRGATVLVVGAGETARLAAAELQRRGAKQLLITSRRAENAERVAASLGAQSVAMSEIADALAVADVVVACTASPVPVITSDEVASALNQRNSSTVPLHMMDLGVPRDIDPAVTDLNGARLYTIEDLRDAYADLRFAASDTTSVAEVEAIVDESAVRFMRDWDSRGKVRDLGRAAEAVRLREQTRTFSALSHLSDDDRAAIESMTRAIVKGVLAGQIEQLRESDE